MTDFLGRDINSGFFRRRDKTVGDAATAGAESRPGLLDEPESGVDLENIALIGQLINEVLGKTHPIRERSRSGLIISHTGYILDYVNARTGYVLCGGRSSATAIRVTYSIPSRKRLSGVWWHA